MNSTYQLKETGKPWQFKRHGNCIVFTNENAKPMILSPDGFFCIETLRSAEDYDACGYRVPYIGRLP